MSDPSFELQKAIFAALRTNPAVADGRIYDRVIDVPTFPYVTIGDGSVLGDDTDCFDASDVTMQVHVWSRAPGYSEAKQIVGLVRDRCTVEFVIPGFKVTEAAYISARYLRDPDGLTSHAVVDLRYLVDHDMA